MNLKEQFALKLAEARKAYEAGDIERGDELKGEAESLKAAMDGMAALAGMESDVKSQAHLPTLPGTGEGTIPAGNSGKRADADDDDNDGNNDGNTSAIKTIYRMRFGEDDAVKAAVLTDLIGRDYKQVIWDQMTAFGRYIRGGVDALDRDDRALLRRQIFSFEEISDMVKNGYSIDAIKTTMIEAQGTLGGYAVPTQMQSEILRKLPGLTAVRGGGATVVNLTTGNAVEYLELTDTNGTGLNRYTSNLRGEWGSETQNPAEKNLTFGQKTITADIYTYKMSLSQSLVEDAANILSIIQAEAETTLAMDEDEAFLIGDGAGKPLGILPGGVNDLNLNEVNSGDGSKVTSNGLKGLKRGVPSQYRSMASWVANSDTYLAVEQLVAGDGHYLFADLSDNEQLLGRTARESEAMPDIASNAYPIIFGNMAGYYIVERAGMTVARFQDSNTGINKVEYHIRRRIGGRVTKPWMFAVQKIAAAE